MPAKRLLKTKKQMRQLGAVLAKNAAVVQTLTPAAGALTAGVVGTPYASTTFAMPNAIGNAKFRITSGSLPNGLALNGATGAVTGTPTQAVAARPVSVEATDDFGNVKVQAYTMTVT